MIAGIRYEPESPASGFRPERSIHSLALWALQRKANHAPRGRRAGCAPDIPDPRARVQVGRIGVHIARGDRAGGKPRPESHDRPQRRPDGPDNPREQQGRDEEDSPPRAGGVGRGEELGAFTAHSWGRWAWAGRSWLRGAGPDSNARTDRPTIEPPGWGAVPFLRSGRRTMSRRWACAIDSTT